MGQILVFLFILTVMWWWTNVRERHHRKETLTTEADLAMRTLRHVAKKRARRSSLPIPQGIFGEDSSPIEMPLAMPMGPPARAITSVPMPTGPRDPTPPPRPAGEYRKHLKIHK